MVKLQSALLQKRSLPFQLLSRTLGYSEHSSDASSPKVLGEVTRRSSSDKYRSHQ